MAFIDDHVGDRHTDADGQGLRWGVESICSQLTELGCTIAPATYYEHRSRRPSAREVRDAQLKPLIARCTVERLMSELGLTGAVRARSSAPPSATPAPRNLPTWWTATSIR